MKIRFPAVIGGAVALAVMGLAIGACGIGGGGADSGKGRSIYYISAGCGCHGQPGGL